MRIQPRWPGSAEEPGSKRHAMRKRREAAVPTDAATWLEEAVGHQSRQTPAVQELLVERGARNWREVAHAARRNAHPRLCAV